MRFQPWFLSTMGWLALSLANAEEVKTPSAVEPVPEANLILGTQAIGGKYQFTDQPALVEAAEVVRTMGATCFKFALRHDPETARVTAADWLSNSPVYRRVLSMPFRDYFLWVNAVQEGAWIHGLSPAQIEAEYRQMYAVAAFLLRTYQGSGKSFYLGHWEGDNMLRGSIEPAADAKMDDAVRVQGFTAWLQARQRAVEDARREVRHEGVQVWHYTEVNHPTISLRAGRPSLASKVLPRVLVDFVSYSAYDAQSDPELLRATLDYLQSLLLPREGLPPKRVFIGEYGFPTWKDGRVHVTPEQQNARSLAVIRTALEWGCPFVLYWELYNNEREADGRHRGFWMIDDQGVKQPIYETHRAYYAWAREWWQRSRGALGRSPTAEEFRAAALTYFKRSAP